MMVNMNMRTILMIVIALFAAAGTALLARGWLNAQKVAISKQNVGTEVLVAKTDVPAGRFVKVQDLRWQAWPKGTLAPTYVLRGRGEPADFEGAVARTRLVAGQPVTDTQVVRPGEQGFLAAVLTPGKRAVSIQVNAITGISGFVFPGDRVDMVLTHTLPTSDGRDTRHVSETVLEDIRVLAVDQRIDDLKAKAAVARTVTFEVTPKQVEKIGIINRIGKIALSLRPIVSEDEQAPVAAGTTVGQAVALRAAPVSAPEDRGVRSRAPALSPISAADAAEIGGGMASDGVSGTDMPVPLIRIEAGDETPIQGAVEVAETEEAPVAGAGGTPAARPLPARERAGLTLDTEVSRVIGRDRRDSGRLVRIMRGDQTEDRRF